MARALIYFEDLEVLLLLIVHLSIHVGLDAFGVEQRNRTNKARLRDQYRFPKIVLETIGPQLYVYIHKLGSPMVKYDTTGILREPNATVM
jgi:predicted TPR repeat methyltransferase